MHAQFALLLASLQLILAQDGPVINTPTSVVQCLPTLLTFHGGSAPYTITAIPAGQVGAAPLVELGSQSGDSYTWITNLPGGTATTLQIRDSRGVINYSQAITVQSSSDSTCLNSGGSGGGRAPTTTPTPGPTNTTSASPGPSTASATATPPSKGGNSPPGGQPNATLPAATPNTTSPNAGSTNTSKGPSPFVPPSNTNPTTTTTTPVSNNANNAASNAPGSAASSVSTLCQQAFIAGLVIAGSLSAIMA